MSLDRILNNIFYLELSQHGDTMQIEKHRMR